MIYTTIISIPNSKIRDTTIITAHIASILNIAEDDMIRWAITATHGDNSSAIVTYAK